MKSKYFFNNSLFLLCFVLLTGCLFKTDKETISTKGIRYKAIEYSKKGEFDSALAEINKAIELNPNCGDSYRIRGVIYSNRGEAEKSMADFNKAIELNPEDYKSYHNRGFYYYKKGELDKAIAEYTKALELNPRSFRDYYDRGVAYSDKGYYARAILNYTEAIELNPDFDSAYANRAYAYVNREKSFASPLKDYDLAILDCNQAIKINPNSANAYYIRAISYQNKKDFKNALLDYNKSLTLNPNLKDVAKSIEELKNLIKQRTEDFSASDYPTAEEIEEIAKTLSPEVIYQQIEEYTDVKRHEISPDITIKDYLLRLFEISNIPNTSGKGEKIVFSSVINDDYTAQNPSSTFDVRINQRIYASFPNKGELRNLSKVITRWVNTSNGSISFLASKSISSSARNNYIYVEKEKGWNKGVYHVELFRVDTLEKVAHGSFQMKD